MFRQMITIMKNGNFILSWSDLNVEVVEKQHSFWPQTTSKKLILNKISGRVQSGALVGILGPSGSGKTTILSALSGRQPISGVVKINDEVISNYEMRRLSGYLHQQDVFFEALTVLEHLQFHQALKLKTTSLETVNENLVELSLEAVKNAPIKWLSGGEKRRLSLAQEMMLDPPILFCDEPTTGLDSFNAVFVLQKLQRKALNGKLVIVSIHQPSSQLFHYFNNIMLLTEAKLVFQGTLEQAATFFKSLGLECPPSYNPADFYLKHLANGNVLQKRDTLTDNIPDNSSCHINQQLLLKDRVNPTLYTKLTNFFYELNWLLWRSYKNIKRNKCSHFGGYLCVMIEFLLVTQIFNTVELSNEHSVQNIEGVLYFSVSEILFTNMYAVITVFPEELAVYLREKQMYSIYSYFLSKILSLIPLCFLSCITYTAVLFIFLNFLKGFHLFVNIVYLYFLLSITACSIGLAFSANFTQVHHIEMIMTPVETILILLSGFFVNPDSMIALFGFLKYLSPFYYGFSSISNLFWTNITTLGGDQNIQYFQNGIEVLESYGLYKTYDIILVNIILLHVIIIIFCLIGFVGIWRKKS